MLIDPILISILRNCDAIDVLASRLYQDYAEQTADASLQAFWKSMSADELVHSGYWEKLLALAKDGFVPDFLDKAFELSAELEQVKTQMQALVAQATAATVREQFSAAFRAESFMLNRGFMRMYRFLESFYPDLSVTSDYERHVNAFLSAMNNRDTTDELKVFGSILARLWRDNNDLFQMTQLDPLTGLLNRRGFLTNVSSSVSLCNRLGCAIAFMMIDIDDFKKVNDTHGHQKGDIVLTSLANTIRFQIRRSDIAGRYGGEEFVVYMPAVDVALVTAAPERFRAAVAETKIQDLAVTVSVGVSSGKPSDNADASIQELIRRADAALYQAKRTGKNRVVLDI